MKSPTIQPRRKATPTRSPQSCAAEPAFPSCPSFSWLVPAAWPSVSQPLPPLGKATVSGLNDANEPCRSSTPTATASWTRTRNKPPTQPCKTGGTKVKAKARADRGHVIQSAAESSWRSSTVTAMANSARPSGRQPKRPGQNAENDFEPPRALANVTTNERAKIRARPAGCIFVNCVPRRSAALVVSWRTAGCRGLPEHSPVVRSLGRWRDLPLCGALQACPWFAGGWPEAVGWRSRGEPGYKSLPERVACVLRLVWFRRVLGAKPGVMPGLGACQGAPAAERKTAPPKK